MANRAHDCSSARISVRLATPILNAIVSGRVVRSSLTEVRDGVPRYEVALALEEAVDWSREAARGGAVGGPADLTKMRR